MVCTARWLGNGNSRTSAMDDFVRLPNHSMVNWFRNRATRPPSYMACLGYIAVYGDGPLINTPVLHTTRCIYDSLIAEANNIYINHDCAVRLKLWDFTQESDVRVWWCRNSVNPWDLSWMVVPTRTSVVHIAWLYGRLSWYRTIIVRFLVQCKILICRLTLRSEPNSSQTCTILAGLSHNARTITPVTTYDRKIVNRFLVNSKI